MANPPITVGELTDVPAPQSPVDAQFHQEVANRIVHRFATTAAMNAWGAGNGSLAFVSPTHYQRVAGAWVALAPQSAVDAANTARANGDTTLQNNLNAHAATPITSAMIQDGTIQPADLAASVLSGDFFDLSAGGPNSNWNGITGFYKRNGPLVTFHMQATKNGSGTALWGTIPVPYRPIYTHYFSGIDISGNIAWSWYADPDGTLWSANTVSVAAGHVFAFDGIWRCA